MGLFTKPKHILCPDLFDRQNNLLGYVRSELLDWVYSIIPETEVHSIILLGSSIGYKWEDDSDIDLQVMLTETSLGRDHWFPIAKSAPRQMLAGTAHLLTIMPLGYFVSDFTDFIFEAYDITNNKWIVPPLDPKKLPNPFEENKTDIIFARLREDEIKMAIQRLARAYRTWKLTGDPEWAEELDRVEQEIAMIFFEIDRQRKMSYNFGWGTPRYSSENIIFKYIEHAKYLEIMQDLYRYRRDVKGEFVDKQI